MLKFRSNLMFSSSQISIFSYTSTEYCFDLGRAIPTFFIFLFFCRAKLLRSTNSFDFKRKAGGRKEKMSHSRCQKIFFGKLQGKKAFVIDIKHLTTQIAWPFRLNLFCPKGRFGFTAQPQTFSSHTFE